jgi:starch synthase
MVTSEAAPFAKTGGLGDVLGALPAALVRLGHDVDVMLPRYRGVSGGEPLARPNVALGGMVKQAVISALDCDGVRMLLVDRPEYFQREYLYGVADHDYPDNPERFAFLCETARVWMRSGDVSYALVHVHDWQTSLLPVLMSRDGGPPVTTVLTIHNLAYQGVFDASWLPKLGLGWDLMRLEVMEFWGRISYLKGGIVFSRLITTVSPRYAREIQTPESGFGFDGILRARARDLVGVLNGIDYDHWDPARDPHLPVPFDASNTAGKAAAKRALLETFGLAATGEAATRPLIGMVSRLVDQKGFDLLAALADDLPRLDATFVLLGTGERRYEDLWLGLAARYPSRVGTRIGFDEGLAHLIEGGADLFLMPSRFEPCGLNQMYSLRYGTLPLVRATGGLFDTVRNYDPRTGEGTGFTFDDYSPQALLNTLRWAIDVYADRDAWGRLQRRAMQQDVSWDASAREYVKVYKRAVT